jgi:hypothetical protein
VKRYSIIVAVALIGLTGNLIEAGALAQMQSYVPVQGFVPDAMTAKKIAEVVLVPIYGQTQIDLEKPFQVTLDHNAEGVWVVRGQLQSGFAGGVFTIRIQKQDGKILSLDHGR